MENNEDNDGLLGQFTSGGMDLNLQTEAGRMEIERKLLGVLGKPLVGTVRGRSRTSSRH